MAADTIILPPQLLNSLQEIAHERGQSVESVVAELVRQFLREQRHAQLISEMDRFHAQHADLLTHYRSEYIGLYSGGVLDHDLDGGMLYRRLQREYGDLPILIVLVTETPDQEITLLSPKFETGA
jgi:hypothetical protein